MYYGLYRPQEAIIGALVNKNDMVLKLWPIVEDHDPNNVCNEGIHNTVADAISIKNIRLDSVREVHLKLIEHDNKHTKFL